MCVYAAESLQQRWFIGEERTKLKIEIPENVLKIIKILNDNAHDAYVVGGCVRDAVLGRIPSDWDITTPALPHEIKKLFRKTFDTGIEHGTVTVLMGDGQYEVTTYRIDGAYSDNRHPDEVTFTDDLKEDLRRRDFTINAMAYSPQRGLVDEFSGIEDLYSQTIRAVGNADERFSEDALRMLRAIRFSAQLDYYIEEDTFNAMIKHAPELVHVSEERIFSELNKAFTSDHPDRAALLYDTGLDKYICKSFCLIKKDAVKKMNPKLSALRHIRWADLCRDMDPKDVGTILKELKTDNDTMYRTVTLVREVKKKMPETEAEIRKELCLIGPELFDDLAELKEASEETVDLKNKIILRGDAYNLKMLDIDGKDLLEMGYPRGPQIGKILNSLLDKVLEDPSLNEKEILKRSLCE